MTPSSDLPEVAQRRLGSGAFSSGLSVPDFAACLELGLEPVALVQGFCAMQHGVVAMGLSRNLGPYAGPQGGYVENYQCPHGMISGEHRTWGQNYQQTWVESTWREGFATSYARMLDEAAEIGAHGVIGVVDTVSRLTDANVTEFHIWGTAVRVVDTPATTTTPWSTYLAGQRLIKVFEAGYVPVAIVAAVSSIRLWAYCITEFLMGGVGMWSTSTGPVEIEQIVTAKSQARSLVRASARSQLGGDALHGVEMQLGEREFESGDLEVEAVLRGNRIRRYKDFNPLVPPTPTVRLS